MKFSIPPRTARTLLFRLIVVHVLGTVFAYNVYNRFTQLGDGYRPESFEGLGDTLTSTLLTHSVYALLGSIFPGYLSPMVLSILTAIVTWFAFRDVYAYLNKRLFWLCNLFPHFLVWTGTSSKEQLVIICGIIVINFAAKRSFADKNLNFNLIFVLISMWVIFFIRPNYFVIYLVIFVTSLFTPWTNKIKFRRLSIGIWIMLFILFSMAIIFYLFKIGTFFSEDVIKFMKAVEYSFLAYNGKSTRTEIQWNDIYDFLYYAPKWVPLGFVGPTFIEAIAKPEQFVAFLEGSAYLVVLCYLFLKLIKLAQNTDMHKLHLMPFIFICCVIVFISYPYLMFNPGSAVRYKQSMHPVLIFYPLLILAYHKANHPTAKNNEKKSYGY